MNDINFAPVCGIYCGDCSLLELDCTGCGNVDGKPFWTSLMKVKVCPLHECCRNQKQLEHCGWCEDFPCKTFLELRDPSMTDDEFEKSLNLRQKELQKRAEIGTEIWLIDKSKG
jgi:hypothetical protein